MQNTFPRVLVNDNTPHLELIQIRVVAFLGHQVVLDAPSVKELTDGVLKVTRLQAHSSPTKELYNSVLGELDSLAFCLLPCEDAVRRPSPVSERKNSRFTERSCRKSPSRRERVCVPQNH